MHGMRVIDPATLKVRHDVVVLYASPTAGVWRAVWRAVRFFAIANAVILLLTGLLVFVFVRRSITPLYQLAAEASTIAANSWKFAPSDEARSVEELEPLVAALEGVIGRLERVVRAAENLCQRCRARAEDLGGGRQVFHPVAEHERTDQRGVSGWPGALPDGLHADGRTRPADADPGDGRRRRPEAASRRRMLR